MQKNVTVKVPNELWINDFSENKTIQFTYSGPESVWIIIGLDNSVQNILTETPVESQLNNSYSIEVNIATAPDDRVIAAAFLTTAKGQHEYTYADETNHDGSIYKRITNPLLKDYFTLHYFGSEFVLRPLVKDTKNPLTEIAVSRKNYVEKYANTFEFDAPVTAQINAYLEAINDYIESVATAYPWKYISYNKNEVPKIPVSLVTLFNSLPDSL